MTKHIFVTGGVVSSLGKGLTSASIGLLLERRGLRVRMQKLDPYINVDPGTMSPYQHGEVYVLDDGSETDLDLGHYERFTNSPLSRESNYTTGQIYLRVIEKERRGEYLGRTVQVVPHITDEIKAAVRNLAGPDVDVVITELGGTVGDIEGLPFLEAIRQIPLDIGKQNCLFIHLTLVPYLKAAREAKTKPTQHSVGQLRQIGIQPDILIVRTERPLGRENCDKIALFCNVEPQAVIEEMDKEFSIYEVPTGLAEHGLDDLIVDKLHLSAGTLKMDDWQDLMQRIRHPQQEVTIAVVGKYIDHRDAYKSIYEALDHAGFAHSARVVVKRIEAEELESQGPDLLLSGVDGVLVPGGFGMRGVEGKVQAAQYAREFGIPVFRHLPGNAVCRDRICPQCAAVGGGQQHRVRGTHAASRHLHARRTEARDAQRGHDAARLAALRPRRAIESGGLLRADLVHERHRHRYEFNPEYRRQFEAAGFAITGTNPDQNLPEIVEIPEHPWFVAVQFHPEFRSKPQQPHPLFAGFIEAAIERHQARLQVTL